MTEASTELAVRPPTALELMLPSKGDVDTMLRIANGIKDSDLVPKTLRGKGPSVFAVMLKGRELGLGLMQSLSEIAMIDGRPALSAHLMLALLRKGGVKILESSTSAERASIKAQRPDGEIMTVEFTFEEAEKITYSTWGEERGVKVQQRLVDKDNWKNYPGDMLWARCVSRLCRRLGGDLLAGFRYSTEEMEDLAADVTREPETMTEQAGTIVDVDAEEVDEAAGAPPDVAERDARIVEQPVGFSLGSYDTLDVKAIKEKIPLIAQRDDALEVLAFIRAHEAQGKNRSSILKLIDSNIASLGGEPQEGMPAAPIETSQSEAPPETEEGDSRAAPAPSPPDPGPQWTEKIVHYLNPKGDVVLTGKVGEDVSAALAKLKLMVPEGEAPQRINNRLEMECDNLLALAPTPPTFADPTADPEVDLLLRRLRAGLEWTQGEWPDDAERWKESHFLELANGAWFKEEPIETIAACSAHQLGQMFATLPPEAKAIANDRVPE